MTPALCSALSASPKNKETKNHAPEGTSEGIPFFEFLRRGELISVENGLQKQNAIDIVVGTKVIIEASCGKPLPDPA
jgi:hypothetical protein